MHRILLLAAVLLALCSACAYASGEAAFNCESGWKKNSGCALTPGDVPVIAGDGKNATWETPTGGGGTECSTSSCDLHVDTTLNSQGICLADGTDCPAATTYGAGGTLLDLTGTTFSVNEGTLTDTKGCKYAAATGLVCDQDYLTGNQTITLSGDVSGSGATAITTTIGNDKITEAMLKAVDSASDEECLTYETTTGDFEWQTCGSGSGDVVGPGSATDTGIALFDTTTGKLLQNSTVKIDATGWSTGPVIKFPNDVDYKLDLYGDRYLIGIESGYLGFYSESKFRFRACGDTDCTDDPMYATLSAQGLLVVTGGAATADPSTGYVGDFYDANDNAWFRIRTDGTGSDVLLDLVTATYEWGVIVDEATGDMVFAETGAGGSALTLHADGSADMLQLDVTTAETGTAGGNSVFGSMVSTASGAAGGTYTGVNGNAAKAGAQNYTGIVSGIYGRGVDGGSGTANIISGVLGFGEVQHASADPAILAGGYFDLVQTLGDAQIAAGVYVDTLDSFSTAELFAIFTEGPEPSRFGGKVKIGGNADDTVTGDLHVHDLTGPVDVRFETDAASQTATLTLATASYQYEMSLSESQDRLSIGKVSGADQEVRIEGDGTVFVSAIDGISVLATQTIDANTNRDSLFGFPSRDLAEEPLVGMRGTATSTAATLDIGGGVSIGNAATNIALYAAAAVNTTTGTKLVELQHPTLTPANGMLHLLPDGGTFDLGAGLPTMRLINMDDTLNITGTSFAGFAGMHVGGTLSFSKVPLLTTLLLFDSTVENAGSLTNLGNTYSVQSSPLIQCNGSIGGCSGTHTGYYSAPSFTHVVSAAETSTLGPYSDFWGKPGDVSTAMTIGTRYGVRISDFATVSGAVTTQIGLKIEDLTDAGTDWSMQVGSAPSYFEGTVRFGGAGAADSNATVHINKADGNLLFQEDSGSPGNPANGTQVRVYMKGDNFIIQYYDGTTKYRYIDLTGTDATWQYGTSEPS